MKKAILIILKIAIIISVILVLKLINLDQEVMDHPLSSSQLSWLNIAVLLNYILALFFLPIALSLVLIWCIASQSLRFKKVKGWLFESLFLATTLFIAHIISSYSWKFSGSIIISHVILLPFYFLLPLLVFSKYNKPHNRDLKLKSLFLNIFVLVVIFISVNNADFLSSSTIKTTRISVTILVVVCSLLLSKQKKAESQTVNFSVKVKKLFRNILKITSIASNLLLILMAFSIISSIVAFIYEYKDSNRQIKFISKTSTAQKDMNVILIVIDALRSDHLGCYGYNRDTSPNIDDFASKGVLFQNCYAHASWTKPSVASILTSLYPSMHGATSHGSALSEKACTMAEVFSENGYLTYGYVANPNLKKIFSFDQGFDFYDDILMQDKLYYAALRYMKNRFPFLSTITRKQFNFSDRDNIELANKRIFPWLKEYKQNNFFMYLHYMDPHDPYSPPSPYKSMFPYTSDNEYSEKISLYDGEIRFTDEHLKSLFAKLRDWGIYDKTMIVITSDHGEAFGEHNDERHGHTIYNELLKVPLIVKYPQNLHASRIINNQVETLDIFPTLLETAGISDSNQLEGISVASVLEQQDQNSSEYIYIDSDYDDIYVYKGIINEKSWKYIYTEKSPLRDTEKVGHEELYNLQSDPLELNNLMGQNIDMITTFRTKLESYRDSCSKRTLETPEINLDPETVRNLKSLGYLK